MYLGFQEIHKCYHWKINIMYIYMLYILRMNITENSSNNHKSTFRIKNFFKKEKTKSLQTFPRWFLYREKYQETFMTKKMFLAPRSNQLARANMTTTIIIMIIDLMVFTWSGKNFQAWNCRICSYLRTEGRRRALADPLFVNVPNYQLAPRSSRYQALKF